MLSNRLRTDGRAVHLKHLLRVRGRGVSSAEQTLLNSFSRNEKTLKNRVIYVLQMDGRVIRCVQKHSPFLCVSRLCRPKRSAVFGKHQTRITSAASHALKAVFLKSPAKKTIASKEARPFQSYLSTVAPPPPRHKSRAVGTAV